MSRNPHKDMDRIYEKNRAFDTAKRKSYYPFGRKKGADVRPPSDAFREGWERIFAKKEQK